MSRDQVSRMNEVVKRKISTSSMFLEYTTFMRGVDVANQLWAFYSSQRRSYNWWQ
jgi:hypothetical protein